MTGIVPLENFYPALLKPPRHLSVRKIAPAHLETVRFQEKGQPRHSYAAHARKMYMFRLTG